MIDDSKYIYLHISWEYGNNDNNNDNNNNNDNDNNNDNKNNSNNSLINIAPNHNVPQRCT